MALLKEESPEISNDPVADSSEETLSIDDFEEPESNESTQEQENSVALDSSDEASVAEPVVFLTRARSYQRFGSSCMTKVRQRQFAEFGQSFPPVELDGLPFCTRSFPVMVKNYLLSVK